MTVSIEVRDNSGIAADRRTLSDEEAWAFAQMLKRITWSEMRSLSVDTSETEEMKAAVLKVQAAFAEAGIAPR